MQLHTLFTVLGSHGPKPVQIKSNTPKVLKTKESFDVFFFNSKATLVLIRLNPSGVVFFVMLYVAATLFHKTAVRAP